MAITSVGYGGTVDYPDYGKGVVLPGRYSFDDSTHFRPTRRTGGADRTVRIAGGTAQGYGIRDTESDDYVDYQLPSVSSGGQWFLIYLKRDWSTETTTLTHEAANTGLTPLPPPIPGGWYDDPGVLARQPICYARVQAGQQYVTEVRDLRVWSNDGGLTATDEGVLQFYDRPGTTITIGRKTWTWSLAPNGSKSLDYIDGEVQDTGWVSSALANSGFEGERRYRVADGQGWFQATGKRTGGNLNGADLRLITFGNSSTPQITCYGQAWVGSSSYRAYITSSGGVHVEPFSINQNQNFQVFITWPVG